jgi:hypothetical protein
VLWKSRNEREHATHRKEIFFFHCKSVRYFNILLFWIDGCLLRKESLHTGEVRVDAVRYQKYITGTDRRTVRAQTVWSLSQPSNARYAVEYHVFAIILALCRSIQSTNPIRQLYTSGYSAYSCLIGLVDLIGGHSALNLAKSPIVSKKSFFNHRAPMQWNGSFCRKSYLPASLLHPILHIKACCSFLLKGIELPPRRSMYGLYC